MLTGQRRETDGGDEEHGGQIPEETHGNQQRSKVPHAAAREDPAPPTRGQAGQGGGGGKDVATQS